GEECALLELDAVVSAGEVVSKLGGLLDERAIDVLELLRGRERAAVLGDHGHDAVETVAQDISQLVVGGGEIVGAEIEVVAEGGGAEEVVAQRVQAERGDIAPELFQVDKVAQGLAHLAALGGPPAVGEDLPWRFE